ncbi:hypothetical protein F4678DRAFT_481999 [Xylaria arbuscula]|nr:hypothetical protein F4678DRAFT_481999 [Xylaria arbuscula]
MSQGHSMSELILLCNRLATRIQLLEIKERISSTFTPVRRWAFAIVTDTATMAISPSIADPPSPAGRVKIVVRIIWDFKFSGPAKIDYYDGCPVISKIAVEEIIRAIHGAGMNTFNLKDGRGHRYWVCVVLFYLFSFMIQTTPGEYMPERAVEIMTRCDIDNRPIEKGTFDMSKLSGEATAALLLCDRAIINFRRLERAPKG